MSTLFAYGLNQLRFKIPRWTDNDVVGGEIFYSFATKTSFKGSDFGVAMMRLIRRSNAPEIIALDTLFLQVLYYLPLESVGARKFTIE